MLKNATYQEKFAMLDKWLITIFEQIKKDLKQDHLQRDVKFYKTHFSGKNLNKLTAEDLLLPYRELLKTGNEELGDFITNRWLIKNSEIYHFFEEKLNAITDNFNELDELEAEQANALINESVERFGAPRTYIFSVLNSVVFPKKNYEDLAKKADQHKEQAVQAAEDKKEQMSLEAVQRSHAAELARVTDKYQKKLEGLQKKYVTDTESLKKQVANLQRKLAAR